MDAQTLREVMGGNLPDGGYTRLIDGYQRAMRAAGITNVRRAAMWAAQLGHESVGLRYMEEIADGSAYNGRRDLGNTLPGDGPRYKGRGPIQLTGRNNYRAFTRWCRDNGHTDINFEELPGLVSEPSWGFLAAAWYWTEARPQINRLADAGDLEGVTRAINGGLNGLADRRARYQRALQYGARLLPEGASMNVTHPMGAPGAWSESSPYGPRWGTMHAGQDYAAPLGTPIYAVADGVVVQGAERPAGTVSGFGNWVWLEHAGLGVDTIYGHMRHHEIYVKRGDRVKAGQLIARVGNEGQSTGPHLHFEVWGAPGRLGGAHRDPAVWLRENNAGAPPASPTPKKEEPMLTPKFFTDFITGYLGPQIDALQDVWEQLRGKGGKGWPQLGQNAQGQNLTLVDGVAALRQDVAALRREIAELKEARHEHR